MVDFRIPFDCVHTQSPFTLFNIFPDCMQHTPSVIHESLWVLNAISKRKVSPEEAEKAVI